MSGDDNDALIRRHAVDDRFKPVTAEELRDDNLEMIANHLHVLQREMRSGFEIVTEKLLTAIERMNNRLDIAFDRQNIADRRADEHARQLKEHAKKIAALEQPKVTRRTTARKKK